MKVLRHSTWKQLALFGLIGPPVGAATILVWSHVAGQPPLTFRLAVWLFIAFPMAYLYGGVPALVTGYAAALARAKAPGSGLRARACRFAVPLLGGPVASVLFSLVTIASESDLSIAAVGAVAVLVCTLLSEWLLRLRPNNSFKPNRFAARLNSGVRPHPHMHHAPIQPHVIALGIFFLCSACGMVYVTWVNPSSRLGPMLSARWKPYGRLASAFGSFAQCSALASIGLLCVLSGLGSVHTKASLVALGVSAVLCMIARLGDLRDDEA